jgi:glycerol kinase
MEADSGIEIKELRVDGGAAQNDLLMQFQSDVLQAPTVRPKIFETTALGAAYLAGLAVGYWKDQAEVSKQWEADRRFEPSAGAEAIGVLRANWRRALERSKAWDQ